MVNQALIRAASVIYILPLSETNMIATTFASGFGFGLWSWIAITIGVVAFSAMVWARGILRRNADYIKRVSRSGNIEEPTASGLARRDKITRFFLWLLVGKVKIKGTENLEKLNGKSFLVCANHGNFADVVVMPEVLRGKGERYMATVGLYPIFGGFGALLFGPMGVIPCALERGKGGAARDAAIDLLSRGNRILVLFPEGYSYCDGAMGYFKKGAVLIAHESAKKLGENVYILPVYIRYGRYPGHWIRRIPIELQYVACLLLAPIYRSGCTVTIGEPIAADQLPADENGDIGEKATMMLKTRVCELDPLGLARPGNNVRQPEITG